MDEVQADRLSLPFTCFALEADEGTDSSNTSILIIYIRYTSGETGEVSTNLFLPLVNHLAQMQMIYFVLGEKPCLTKTFYFQIIVLLLPLMRRESWLA